MMTNTPTAMAHPRPTTISKSISSAIHSKPTHISEQKAPTPNIVQSAVYQKEPSEFSRMDAIQASLVPTKPSSKSNYGTLSTASIVAPIVSVCGGIVLIAAAMFFIVATKRKRGRRRRRQSQENREYNDRDDEDRFHDVSLSDDEDNSRIMHAKSTRLTATEKPPLPPMPPLSSRTSSITLTSHARPKSTGSFSTTSTIYADALSSPMGSIKCPKTPVLKIAERQQLSHQRPSIIQTYRAQLSNSVILPETQDSQDPILPFQYYTCIR
ncbi:hypothetical protein A0J61_06327 [Choanephora cucurbitarum]|uniref:Uncharacterized protein n=1 Tax=Choanephora cucurbitarum TaxID=101091 RepID=A0A1C7N919_9FUNG|nr:hypothetical protein A0J61_06327 [Choanephora cucurbitarum]